MSVSKAQRRALQQDATGNRLLDSAVRTVPITSASEGEPIKYLERMLKLAGFDPGTQDRRFSTKTEAALKEFQKARGLPETGQLDARTLKHLQFVQKNIRKHTGKKGKVEAFGAGMKNEFIATQEKRLRKLGYDVGKADGTFDLKTAEAVKAFKADQAELKDSSGWIGKNGMASLAKESKALDHKAYRGRTGKDIKGHQRLDAATKAAVTVKNEETGLTGIGVGSKGREVKNIQWRLRAAGFDPKRQDGVFDERTEAALKAFQKRSGLEPHGRVGPGTWGKLSKSVIYAKGDASPPMRLGEKSSAVKRLEKLFVKLGLKTGKVDGLFDQSTLKASRAFERNNGMKVEGSVGAKQLSVMKKQSKGVTLRQLRSIMPNLSSAKAASMLPHLNRAMAEAGINTERRKAYFLANLAHESGELRYFEEIASGAAYEGRRDLGNVRPGDGVRYKGRGPIQLTGRANYRAAGKALGLPLEANPKMASTKAVGFRIAAWYWKSRGLNGPADRGDFISTVRGINGGTNGLSSRQMYLRRALAAL